MTHKGIITKEELGKLYPIILKTYNADWPRLFEKEKNILRNFFGNSLKIEHIGSTAVKEMTAKPTVDILLEMPKNLNKDQVIKIMQDNAYIHMKEQTKHLMFVKGYTPKGLDKESYHIHIGPLTQDWLWDRIFFRDYLIENTDEARIYEKLKQKLSKKYRNDREAYTDGKEKYIKKITTIAKAQYLKLR